MKKYFVVITICFFQIGKAQNEFKNQVLDRIIGYKQAEKNYITLGNYSIFTDLNQKEFSAKNIQKLKKKYLSSLNGIYSKSNLISTENHVFTSTEDNSGLKMRNKIYFLKKSENEIDVIGFYSLNYSDSLIEKEFIELYLTKQLQLPTLPTAIQTFDFAGRNIEVGGSCQILGVSDIQCPYFGEMNWAIHESLVIAKQCNENQFLTTKNRNMVKVLKEEDIDILFEEKPTKAKRIHIKVSVPKMVTGGSNELIIYYIAEEIRGRFVSCVMSHYTNDTPNESGVPAFLGQIIKLK